MARIYRTVHDSPGKASISRRQALEAVRTVKARWEAEALLKKKQAHAGYTFAVANGFTCVPEKHPR